MKEHAEERFKNEVCSKADEIDLDDEIDWKDMSIGFFLACGLSVEQAKSLATDVRYNKQYWS